MLVNKVEICGVNTSKLPVLTNEQRKSSSKECIKEIPRQERNL